jgi:hypothetical protein
VYFLALTGRGVLADFSPDDLMNMHEAWSHPVSWWAGAVVKYWSAAYRPAASLFYAVFFSWFQFNPLPFRLVCFAVLLCNVGLLWWVTRRLTGSEEAGALAAALGSVHVNYQPLYYSTGNCYDVFCFLFYFGALAVYLRWRGAGEAAAEAMRQPQASAWGHEEGEPQAGAWGHEGGHGRWWLGAVAVLYVLALDCKELAVTLPGIVLVYEALLTPDWRRWRKYLPGLALAVMTVPFVIGKTSGDAVFFRDPAYTPHFSVATYFHAWPSYLNELFLRESYFGDGRTALFLVATLALCIGSRARLFGWLVMTLGLVPIALVPPRGISAAYIPLAGLALIVGSVLAALRWRRVPALVWLGAVLAVSGWVQVRCGIYQADWMLQEQRRIRAFVTEIGPHVSNIPRGGRVLFRPDPFEDCAWGRWSSTFVLRMWTDDHDLLVDRWDQMEPKPTEEQVAGYSVVFRGTSVQSVKR